MRRLRHESLSRMTDHHTPVTVLGLGSMGSALAAAFIEAGHRTTVWNRTASKALPLVSQGAVHATTIAEAVAASPLIITCLTTYEGTIEALEPAAAVLEGRALVSLNSGSPAGARAMDEWVVGQGARYLGGAVKNVPSAVGAEDTLLYYGGDESVFDEFAPTLRVLGGDTVYLGADVDLAALYEMAVGGTLLPALVGFFQGAAALQAPKFSRTRRVLAVDGGGEDSGAGDWAFGLADHSAEAGFGEFYG